MAKLTPNVADIGAVAVACAEVGAAAISAINTVAALEIDATHERPLLGNGFGGLSGAAVRTIGQRRVADCVRALRTAGHATPVVGIGGIATGEDAAKYLLCGAEAVQVGSALAGDPMRLGTIADELVAWMDRQGRAALSDFRGRALEWLP